MGDISGLDKSLDGRRVRYMKNGVNHCVSPRIGNTLSNLNCCFRPTSPDDLPIVGAMKFYPNMFLNAGHSGRGLSYGLVTSKIIEELVEGRKGDT